MKLIDGKETAKKIRIGLKEEVDELKKNGINPKLAVIMVGDDKASAVYVRNKSKACEEIGIEFEEFLMDNTTTQKELIGLINKLNNREDIHGILLQSPIPKGLDIREAFNTIDYRKDVDGFNPINVGKLSIGEDCFISCTPYGVIKLLEEYNISTEGKRAVIIGRSNIVGKPLIQCLLNKNATVTVCHSKTMDLEKITKYSEIIGLTFQIKDDILSAVGDEKILGKPVGNDARLKKVTYVSKYGLEGAKRILEEITEEAINELKEYGEKAEFLKELAIYIKNRNK